MSHLWIGRMQTSLLNDKQVRPTEYRKWADAHRRFTKRPKDQAIVDQLKESIPRDGLKKPIIIGVDDRYPDEAYVADGPPPSSRPHRARHPRLPIHLVLDPCIRRPPRTPAVPRPPATLNAATKETIVSYHLDSCGADEDPDGATMCVCASIERERAAYDPREEEECTPELVDGHVIGCGVCEACR